ncbi:MAG TPA: 50S ribosomal protein L21 [Planctomycetota bacterium]|nr:50S ribosomal protein L21 [Planctomycetota bacterium]
MEYAIFKDSGVQFQVKVGDRVEVDKTDGEPQSAKTFGEVLLLNREGDVKIGTPTVAGASVKATLLEQFKGPKVYSFKIFEMNSKAVKKGFRAKKTAFVIEKICATAAEASAWDAARAKK